MPFGRSRSRCPAAPGRPYWNSHSRPPSPQSYIKPQPRRASRAPTPPPLMPIQASTAQPELLSSSLLPPLSLPSPRSPSSGSCRIGPPHSLCLRRATPAGCRRFTPSSPSSPSHPESTVLNVHGAHGRLPSLRESILDLCRFLPGAPSAAVRLPCRHRRLAHGDGGRAVSKPRLPQQPHRRLPGNITAGREREGSPSGPGGPVRASVRPTTLPRPGRHPRTREPRNRIWRLWWVRRTYQACQ